MRQVEGILLRTGNVGPNNVMAFGIIMHCFNEKWLIYWLIYYLCRT